MKKLLKICFVFLFVFVAGAVLWKLSVAGAIPSGISSYCEEADYVLKVSGDSLEGKVDFKVRPFRRGEFRLLSSQVALISVMVDGHQRPVFEKDGFFVVFLKRAKKTAIKLKFAKKILDEDQRHHLELVVPRPSRSSVRLLGIKGQHVVLNGFGFNEFEKQEMPDSVSLILPPSDRLNISWQRSKPGDKPARVFAQRHTLIEIKDKMMYYRTICNYRIKDGQVSSLDWFLADGAKKVEVKADNVHFSKVESEGGQKILRIQLTAPVKGDYTLELNYSLAYENDLAVVAAAVPAEVMNEDEYIAVGSREKIQIVPVVQTGLNEVALDEAPSQLVNMTEIPLFGVYHRMDEKAELKLCFIKYGRAEGVETAVDEAEYEFYFLPSGQEIVRATFEVRNTHNQFMQLQLPEGAMLCSVRSMDRPVVPLRLKDGKALIPLEKSIESFSGYVTFPIDICYILNNSTRAEEQEVAAALPALGVPVSYLKWRLVLPRESRVKWKERDVYSVDRFSDETAQQMLEYARAGIAGGKTSVELGDIPADSDEAGYVSDAFGVLDDVVTDEEPDESQVPAGSMPEPKVMGKDFKQIDFGKLYKKVTTYSKKISDSEKRMKKGGVQSVKVSGDITLRGVIRDNYGLSKEEALKNEKKAGDLVKKKLSAGYSRKAQQSYRSGSIEKAQKEISRALETNIAQKEALQLAENVQKLQKIETELEEKEDALSVSSIARDEGLGEIIAGEPYGDKIQQAAEQVEQKSRIYSQVKTYRKDRGRGRRAPVEEGFWSGAQGPSATIVSARPEPVDDMFFADFAAGQRPPVSGRSVLLRYNLILLPEALSRGMGHALENRAEPAVMEANKDYRNWDNAESLSILNSPNAGGYNRMNLDAVQENTLVDILNESYGAGNILASRVVRVAENSVYDIPFAGSYGTGYAKVRPVIVDEEYIDFYITLPRTGVKGTVGGEETAVRIKRGQTAVVGGISGAIAAVGREDSGLVLMLSGDILDKMAEEDVEIVYARRYMDISIPAGDVYKFEKLLVKADEVLTITMEVTR